MTHENREHLVTKHLKTRFQAMLLFFYLWHVRVVRLSKTGLATITLHRDCWVPSSPIDTLMSRHYLRFPRIGEWVSPWRSYHTTIGRAFGHFVGVIAGEGWSCSNVSHSTRRLAVCKLRVHKCSTILSRRSVYSFTHLTNTIERLFKRSVTSQAL